MRDTGFTLVDGDFYGPVGASDPGRRFRFAAAPQDWSEHDHDVWTMWSPDGVVLPEQGWKVHVSAALATADAVLDVVAGVCLRMRVPFKHLSGRNHFVSVHGKHANRVQSGKFCALYPPGPEVAHELLRTLERELAGVAGPYVLTDRRFGSSACVSYRYGAFRSSSRLEADGTSTSMVRNPDGDLVPDLRRPEFLLPDGVADPFLPEPGLLDQLDDEGDVSFGGYTFESVLQHSNAGGAYRARTADGRTVFVKEARAHNGYTSDGTDSTARLRAEYLTLRTLHAAAPGLCPEPVELFTHWEHTYLVTEHVAGRTLMAWTVANTPTIRAGSTPADFAAYYRRARHLLDQIRAAVDRLHEAGYVFIDLNPRNVMVDDDDTVRLIDFESAQNRRRPISCPVTPGFVPPELMDTSRHRTVVPEHIDDYGIGALAQTLVFPIHQVADRSPDALHHVLAELDELAPVPSGLRADVLRFRPGRTDRLPAPDEVRAAPREHLAWLRDATATAIEELAGAQDGRLFPLGPDSYRTNARCVAHGTAGVLHALHVAGRPIDPEWTARLRDRSLAGADQVGPGLFTGNAGIALVLAELGEEDAADALLDAASTHPLVARRAGLGGAAGLATALLHRYRATGDGSRLDAARRLLDLPTGDALVARLDDDDPSGLARGRPGIALALHHLARLDGDPEPLRRGLTLLREELRHSQAMPVDGLGFRVTAKDRRNMPYLAAGSAGYALVLGRYLHDAEAAPDLSDAFDRCLRSLSSPFTVSAGLFMGQAGLGLVLGDLARVTGRAELQEQALRSARALVKFAVPGGSGVRWTGAYGERFSTDLSGGAAGVLLALQRTLVPAADLLLTPDHATRTARVPA